MSSKINDICPKCGTKGNLVIEEDGISTFSCPNCGAIYDDDMALEEGDCLLINSIVDIFRDHDE